MSDLPRESQKVFLGRNSVTRHQCNARQAPLICTRLGGLCSCENERAMLYAEVLGTTLFYSEDIQIGRQVSENSEIRIEATPGRNKVEITQSAVRGVQIYRFPWIRDPRGDLTVGEFTGSFPFLPKRYFIVFGVSAGTLRGEHAHRNCHQFLLCAQGQCTALVDDGTTRQSFVLDNPSVGLYIPPLIWGTQYDYSHNGSLLVFASESYDPADYIRSYEEFQRVVSVTDR